MPSYQFVSTQSKLYRFLDEIETATWIAYDTEFISEGRYRPDLCLVQVAVESGNYLLDPLAVRDLNPFWERLCREGTTSIAHSCRCELEFCYRAIGRIPTRIFDVQLAAAFVGFDYPLNFKALTEETIGVKLEKTEARTDWSRRPLLRGQLDYAIQDVCYLKQIADYLTQELEKRNRTSWFIEETREFCKTTEDSFGEDHWRKILGSKKFSRNELAIIRELWFWRRDKALAKGVPQTRILRDDLILELGKLKTADPERIAVLRGIKGTVNSALVAELQEQIADALSLDDSEKPVMEIRRNFPQYALATQLINILIGQYCHEHEVSARLAATVSDVRDAIASYAGSFPKGQKAKLMRGWRAEFLGKFVEDFLSGRYAMQFSNNLEDLPLKIIDVYSEK